MKRMIHFFTLFILLLCLHSNGWGQSNPPSNHGWSNEEHSITKEAPKATPQSSGASVEQTKIANENKTDRQTKQPKDNNNKPEKKEETKSKTNEKEKVKKEEKKEDKKDIKKEEKATPVVDQPKRKEAEVIVEKPAPKKKVTFEELEKAFSGYIEKDSYYNRGGIDEEYQEIKNWLTNIKASEDKEAYIKDNDLEAWVKAHKEENEQHSGDTYSFVDKFIDTEFAEYEVDDDSRTQLREKLNERIEEHENNLYPMESAVEEVVGAGLSTKTLITLGIVLVALVLLIFIMLRFAKKKKQPSAASVSSSPTSVSHYASTGPATIVVKQKNGTVLRKQNIDDVLDNDNYLKIDSHDFCADSAVRFMYLKNTCIKSIYHLYAEDLRNPERQKEDGCMVLGRWVFNDDCRQYDVTLEEIVLPGDDAVFKEYELNFGGKIQMKKTEKLRILRRNTDLQYDLTCWVHSHPGLGVFFSNADTNVHTQLKHPTHPGFLTAMVVDILTPTQETGIFTFKHDNSICSKNDLTKMYSLEELYKWAVESERTAFKPEHHFNTLSDTENRADDCHSIQLSSGTIIDMDMLTNEHKTGITAFAHGYTLKKGEKTEMVVTVVSERESVADAEWIGCFVSCPTYNITQVRKSTTGKLKNSQFVLVYSADNDTLTTIPVVGGRISVDEKTYGKQKFEDLKTWTRRRR